jgi:hypothetical protein
MMLMNAMFLKYVDTFILVFIGDILVYWKRKIVTSRSTEHTFIDLFFEDTCVQVIRLGYIVILFQLWIIHDDDDVF